MAYRRYEDPHALEKRLEKVKEQLAQCTDDCEYEWLCEEQHDLEERINFAWQDDEYDCDYMHENYPEEF